MFTFSTLSILLPIAVFLHVTEEFLFPGGFIEWYQKLVPSQTKGIRPGYLVWINTLMMFACMLPLYYGETTHGINAWYLISVIAAINACFHIWGVLKIKIYSPGIVTGVLLYMPLFIIGTKQLLLTGDISWSQALWFVVGAVGYHIFSVIRQAK